MEIKSQPFLEYFRDAQTTHPKWSIRRAAHVVPEIKNLQTENTEQIFIGSPPRAMMNRANWSRVFANVVPPATNVCRAATYMSGVIPFSGSVPDGMQTERWTDEFPDKVNNVCIS